MRFRDDAASTSASRSRTLSGKRVLIIEDEPLVAMDLETLLTGAGCTIVAHRVEHRYGEGGRAERPCDVALLDANLGGEPVDEVAAALTRRGIPFAFATGHGREPCRRHSARRRSCSSPSTRNRYWR